jgi:hypothetical protein
LRPGAACLARRQRREQSNRVSPSSWAARSIRGAAHDTARTGLARSGAVRAATLAMGLPHLSRPLWCQVLGPRPGWTAST